MPGAINNWDKSKPAGTDYIDASDELIRNNWGAIEVMTGAITQNLTVKNGSIASRQVDIDADRIALFNTASPPLCYVARSVDLTADITTSGANGLDGGTEANSTWYYAYLIYNPSTGTVASVLSTATAWASVIKTNISGYTFARLVGVVYNDSSGNFVEFRQVGNRATYKNPQTLLTNGTATTWTTVSLTALVPATIIRRAFGWVNLNSVSGGDSYASIDLAADTSGNYQTSRLAGICKLEASGAYTSFYFEQELTQLAIVYKVAGLPYATQADIIITGYFVEI